MGYWAELFLLFLRGTFTVCVVLWFLAMVIYLFALILGHFNKWPHHRYVFPLWRKQNGATDENGVPVIKFSLSSFWLWVVLPFCLFLMSFAILFLPMTQVVAAEPSFWVSVFGAIGGVLANYYFGKRLTTPEVYGQSHSTPDLPGKPGNPGVIDENP